MAFHAKAVAACKASIQVRILCRRAIPHCTRETEKKKIIIIIITIIITIIIIIIMIMIIKEIIIK